MYIPIYLMLPTGNNFLLLNVPRQVFINVHTNIFNAINRK